MNVRQSWAPGLLSLLLLGAAGAQEPVFVGQGAADGTVLLLPATEGGAQTPLFLNQAQPPVGVRSGGTVNQLNVGNLGNLQVGFDYLRPVWSFRDFLLAVPDAAAPSFLLGDTGHVDDHFTFAPRIDYNYRFEDSAYGIAASGTFLNLSGQLQRQVTAAGGGVGRLTASSSLTIVTANLVEFTGQLTWAELWGDGDGGGKKKHGGGGDWEDEDYDLLINFSIGTRYSSIDQNYNGSLISSAAGTNVSTRYSTQSFRGLGVTGSVDFAQPVSERLVLFSHTRGSLVYGENRKDSTLTVNVAGQPGNAQTIEETSTELVPILEQQLGGDYALMLRQPVVEGDVAPLLVMRLALVGQFWGGVGPLSAGSTQGFRDSDLYLVGITFTVGFHH